MLRSCTVFIFLDPAEARCRAVTSVTATRDTGHVTADRQRYKCRIPQGDGQLAEGEINLCNI